MADDEQEPERYRKVSLRIWGDSRFRNLSRPEPNAQSLWFQLLTGPYTTLIPGVVLAGASALAEVHGWDVKRYLERFQEVADSGMAFADWTARIVWLPNGIYHNEPENPNQVKGWRSTWPLVPESPLKYQVFIGLRDYMAERGETFLQTFLGTFREPSANVSTGLGVTLPESGAVSRSSNRSSKQERSSAASPPEFTLRGDVPRTRTRTDSWHTPVKDRYFALFEETQGSKPVWSPKEAGQTKQVLDRARSAGHSLEEVLRRMERGFRDPPATLARGGGSFTMGAFLAFYDTLAGAPRSPSRTNDAGEKILTAREIWEMAHPREPERETVQVQGRVLVPEGEV